MMRSWVLLFLLLVGAQLSAMPADIFFKPPGIEQISISPDGQLVAMIARPGDQRVLEIATPLTGQSQALKSVGWAPISSFRWLGPRTLSFKVYVEEVQHWQRLVLRFKLKDGKLVDTDFQTHNTPASVIDSYPETDDFVLMYISGSVYRYPLNRRKISGHFDERYKTDDEMPFHDGVVLSDGDHAIRFAMSSIREEEDEDEDDEAEAADQGEESTTTYYRKVAYRSGNEQPWQFAERLNADYFYQLIGFAENGSDVVMISDYDRNHRSVLVYRPETSQFVDMLWEMSGVDVAGASLNDEGKLSSVSYYVNGFSQRVDLIDAGTDIDRIKTALNAHDKQIHLVEESLDGNYQLIAVRGSSHPSRYLHYDRNSRHYIDLGSVRPELEQIPGIVQHTVTTESDDGLSLEAYLSLPSTEPSPAGHPLLVIPHGGPFGIRATAGYDNETHFFTSNGIAVLHVNFRGSGGFGREFIEKGRQEYGAGIESDIEAMVDAAIEQHPIDADRICAYGVSYGGYSSMMLVLTKPQRYRCAASFAGVTDVQLMYSSSDWIHNERSVSNSKKWWGNPETQAELMDGRSPVYLAENLARPLLIAHGTEDYRVDIEHYYRMTMMLDHFGKPYQGIVYPGEGHGFSDDKLEAEFHERLIAFLDDHLAREDGIELIPSPK
ncbi:MAG: hypothetical protein DHS20C11_30080 [Lysobacteraceae bacterium]|nr:MAG: hypothetical protein DHS20C11_30080 [Xanthomonadaceae bacterium]